MRRALAILAAAVLAAGLSFASGIQEKKAADKLAPFCGDYSFDLTSFGAGVIKAKFFVENEDLFVIAETAQTPDKLSPVENEPTKFFLDDPDEGHWDFEFIKDAQGKIVRCRIVNAGLGIDSTGDKIGG
jgi:hypothetical protein